MEGGLAVTVSYNMCVRDTHIVIVASLTAVMLSTSTKGTMVVNQDNEEICGIN